MGAPTDELDRKAVIEARPLTFHDVADIVVTLNITWDERLPVSERALALGGMASDTPGGLLIGWPKR